MTIEVSVQQRYSGFDLDISFETSGTGITALFGPSGAGKTTVINAMAGLLKPEGGRISIGGRLLFDPSAGICVPPYRRRVGYVFQDSRLFPHLDVEANLRFGWRRAANRLGEIEVSRAVAMLGLETFLKRKPSQLSGGEKARVAIGRALLAAPDFLLMDEPLAALDYSRKQEILPYLERLRGEGRIPIVYVSHSLDEISRLANTLILIKAGRVASSGPLTTLLSDLDFTDLVGGTPYGAVLEARIEKHLAVESLSLLAFNGGRLLVPLLSQPEGSEVRMRVPAQDVILALERPRAISTNNILPTTIVELRESTSAHVDVRLACGPSHLLARITRASCRRLGLREGLEVSALVKSVTVVPAGTVRERG